MIFEYENDVQKKPEHLSKEFYTKVVQNAIGIAEPELSKVQCSMGSKCGEKYCSQIYRSKIHYKNEENANTEILSVIIKIMPDEKDFDFLKTLSVFSKEITIYTNILPCFNVLMANKQRFGAKIYHYIFEPAEIVVFEDLSASDYSLTSRESGLDEVHSRLVMKRLAQFHACSMVLAKMDSSRFQNFTSGFLSPDGPDSDEDMLVRYFKKMIGALAEVVSKKPEFEEIVPKLKKYQKNIRTNVLTSQLPSPEDKIRVLNHGDMWVNNLLFKYDDKRPNDLIFVDYQMSIWSSPGVDLNYFFFTSLKFDLLKHKRSDLIEHYHQELSKTLKELNHSDIPSLKEIQNEVKNRLATGMFANFCAFPTQCANEESSSDNTFESLTDEDMGRKKLVAIFESKRVEETLNYTIKEFDELGLFD